MGWCGSGKKNVKQVALLNATHFITLIHLILM